MNETRSLSIRSTAMQAAMIQLAAAARTRGASSIVCNAVATLIAGAGSRGGAEMQEMMDLAASCGFEPSYYANGVRVSFPPKDVKA